MASKEEKGHVSSKSLSALIQERLESSSTPGLSNIKHSKSVVGKIFWVSLVCFGFVVVCIQVTKLYNEFKTRPIRVTITYEYSRSLPFPAVTICNLNPLRASMLGEDSGGFDQLTSQPSVQNGGRPKPPQPPQPPPAGQPKSTAQPGQPMSTLPLNNVSTYEYSVTFDVTTLQGGRDKDKTPSHPEPHPPNKRKSPWEHTTSLTYALFNKTVEEKHAMGHQLEDMLLDCSWNGVTCSHSDFTRHFNDVYGNCYTFNFGANGSEILSTTKPGPSYGLRLELFLEQDEYMPNYTETAGMRVLLHDQNIMPFPAEEGFNIPPGMLSATGVTTKVMKRLPYPHGDCHLENDNSTPQYYEYVFGVNYSLKVCERSCYQSWLIMECDCMDPEYPGPPPINGSKPVRSCDQIGGKYPTDPDCLERAEELFADNVLDCGCTQPCREKQFEMCLSSSLWPANKFNEEVLDGIKSSYSINQSPDQAHQWLMENVARLDVYFQQLSYEYVQEVPAYTEKNLMSDIGGQFGLWIGISLITVFEFFELFCLVVSKICRMVSTYLQEKNKKFLSKTFRLLRQSSTASESDVVSVESKGSSGVVNLKCSTNKDSIA